MVTETHQSSHTAHLVAKGTVSKGITEVVLQEGDNIRAVAYIKKDHSGHVELQQRINEKRDWYCILKEPKTVDEMKYTLSKVGKIFSE